MRTVFVKNLEKLMGRDERIVLLTADLGYSILNPIFEKFPQRAINVGVAEENMAGMATGMARSGLIPFIYSIATFASMRGYEFIRNGAVVHELPVRVVGIGGGFEYGSLGISHYALEDFAIMRAQPGMTVIAPVDSMQVATALEKSWNLPGPVYYRIGKSNKPPILGLNGEFRLGKLEVLSDKGEIAFLATGGILSEALEATQILREEGIECRLGAVACLSPAPFKDIKQFLNGVNHVFTVESHYITGGLGTLVAELIAEKKIPCQLHRAAVRTVPDTFSGSQEFMEKFYGLDTASLIRGVHNLN